MQQKTSRIHQCEVIDQQQLSLDYRRLILHAPALGETARAGQFVHVLPRSPVSSAPLLRRAFSIMAVENGRLELLYRVLGKGTQLMSAWHSGQQIDLLGPLGKPFPAPAHPVILIGGGVGTPPMVMLARQIAREQPHLPITALIGARSQSEVLGQTELQQSCDTVHLATDDGSAGRHGFVTTILEEILQNNQQQYSIYSCGPLPMLHRVAHLCAAYEQRALLSLEENMPCGIGVCNGCAVPVNSDAGEYHQYSRVCVDGPGMWSDQIDWDKLRC